MKVNLAFLTGARSEYGVAKPLLKKMKSDPDINLMIFPNGMHLLKEFGYTVNEIREDGFEITESINTYNSIKGKSHQFSNSVKSIYDVLNNHTIDLVYIIGDRIEAYTAALAAHFLKIPIAHFGGGAITQGAVDNIYRFNITNLSEIHFTTSKNNYQRVLDCILTNNENVYFTGSTAIDGIIKYRKNKKNVLRTDNQMRSFALMTFHPVTLGDDPIANIMDSTINCILAHDCNVFITYPNNDNGYKDIIKVINKWKKHEKVIVKRNLGAEVYYNAIDTSLFVIGNSSSGIIEVPYFDKPVVNVGTRQLGRDKDSLVKDVEADTDSVNNCIKSGFNEGWKNRSCSKLYGDGTGTKKIINVIKSIVSNVNNCP